MAATSSPSTTPSKSPQAAFDFHTDPVRPIAPQDPVPADDFDQSPAFDPADPEPVPELHLG